MLHSRAAIVGWFYAICVGVLFAPATSHAASATITFDSPRGGEEYALGQVQKVRLGKTPSKAIKIELSRDGGTTFELLGSIDNLVKDINLRNVLSFTVAAPASSNCVIRASGAIGMNVVVEISSPFSIGSAGGPLNGSVTSGAISSGSALANLVLTADGSGGASFGPLPLDSRYVKVAGDTMTGLLTLSGNPTVGLQAATKQYVDAETTRAQTAETAKVSKAGDTMSGSLTLPLDGLIAGNNQLVLSGGNVGMGVAIPAAKLDLLQSASGQLSAANILINNAQNSGAGLVIATNGLGRGIDVLTTGTGNAGIFQVDNAASGAAALQAGVITGDCPAFSAGSSGTQEVARLVGNNTSNNVAALYVENHGTAEAGTFQIINAANSGSVIRATTNGTGTGITVDHRGASGDIAVFQNNGGGVARIDKSGNAYFGTVTATGAIQAVSSTDIKITVASTSVLNGAAINLQNLANVNSPRMEWQLVGSDTDQQSYMRANYIGATTVACIMCVKGNGNVGIGLSNPTSPLHMSSGAVCTAGGVWTNASDRNLKENLAQVDGERLLAQIAELPLYSWNYKSENKSVRHIGPMAQDFYSIFALGNNNTSISTIDPSGIALVAIQELVKQNKELNERLAKLEGLVKAAK